MGRIVGKKGKLITWEHLKRIGLLTADGGARPCSSANTRAGNKIKKNLAPRIPRLHIFDLEMTKSVRDTGKKNGPPSKRYREGERPRSRYPPQVTVPRAISKGGMREEAENVLRLQPANGEQRGPPRAAGGNVEVAKKLG